MITGSFFMRRPMWIREDRALPERKGVRYPLDLRDEEWTVVEPPISPAKRGGRRREVERTFASTPSPHSTLPSAIVPLRSTLSLTIPLRIGTKNTSPRRRCEDDKRLEIE